MNWEAITAVCAVVTAVTNVMILRTLLKIQDEMPFLHDEIKTLIALVENTASGSLEKFFDLQGRFLGALARLSTTGKTK